jgi:hypothetical protein
LAVFVLDKRKKPLVPCSKKITPGRALVHRHCPLTIRLKDRIGGEVGPLQAHNGFAVPASPVAVFGRAAFHPRLPATVASGGF